MSSPPPGELKRTAKPATIAHTLSCDPIEREHDIEIDSLDDREGKIRRQRPRRPAIHQMHRRQRDPPSISISYHAAKRTTGFHVIGLPDEIKDLAEELSS